MPRTMPSRVTQIAVSAGVGAAVLFIVIRWFRRRSQSSKIIREVTFASNNNSSSDPISHNSSLNSDSSTIRPHPASPTPSLSSVRSRQRHSTSLAPLEAELVHGLESCQELTRCFERANSSLELTRNRSDKDRARAEAAQSVLDRLRVLATDINRLVSESGIERFDAEGEVGMISQVRSGTLSVLSDDSFMSAFEEFPSLNDGEHVEESEVNMDQQLFYQIGLEKATNGLVLYRKSRAEMCMCENDTEFAAKLYCVRNAFKDILLDEHRRLWLAKSGRQILAGILKHSKQDPATFYTAYDSLLLFLEKESNQVALREELFARGVREVSFWDVVLDFILLDAFDDMKSPPSAIFSVTKNYFLSQQMKYSTISTIIWSMLKAKRQRLKNPSGFIAHFYNVSEAVSPAITLGFLGTEENIGELCRYFKDQITGFILDIFSMRRVRYTSLQDLKNDVWICLESRAENVMTRLSSELLPA